MNKSRPCLFFQFCRLALCPLSTAKPQANKPPSLCGDWGRLSREKCGRLCGIPIRIRFDCRQWTITFQWLHRETQRQSRARIVSPWPLASKLLLSIILNTRFYCGDKMVFIAPAITYIFQASRREKSKLERGFLEAPPSGFCIKLISIWKGIGEM